MVKRSPPPQPSPPLSSPSSPSSSNFSSNSTCKLRRRIHKATKPKPKNSKKAPSQTKDQPSSPHGNAKRSSIYRGVTRHRWTGRFEAHLWDKHCWNPIQNKKGRQVYLGAYDSEEAAAHAYDLAALKYWGPETVLNFPLETYDKEMDEMQAASKEEYLASLRRRSSGFSRGVSKYRGVARHHHNGRWEARIGRVFGNKYLYLGTFSTQEEAAQAYDLAAIEYRGVNAVTNFDINCYLNQPQLLSQLQPEPQIQRGLQAQPQYERSENVVLQEPTSGETGKPLVIDENFKDIFWSPCMDNDFDAYMVTGDRTGHSTDLSEWFNDVEFEDIACLFEGCPEIQEGNEGGGHGAFGANDGVRATETGLVREVEKPEDVLGKEGIASQVKSVSYPPTMISICT